MDRIAATFAFEDDDDLALCMANGVAYQRDTSHPVAYDEAYYEKCRAYEGADIANKINAGRIALVNKYVGADEPVLDIGVGSGEFVKLRPNTWGYDINPVAADWLREHGKWADISELSWFNAVTLHDVVEHLPSPQDYLDNIDKFLFCAVPIHQDLRDIRKSKHYRPHEHLLHFTYTGFVDWMERYGFEWLETQAFEIDAGRDSIYSFAFRRK